MSSLWHPFANMANVSGNELVIDRGDGCYVYDKDGKRYLDGTAGLWFANVIHSELRSVRLGQAL